MGAEFSNSTFPILFNSEDCFWNMHKKVAGRPFMIDGACKINIDSVGMTPSTPRPLPEIYSNLPLEYPFLYLKKKKRHTHWHIIRKAYK